MLLVVAALPLEFAGFRGLVTRASPETRWLATTSLQGREALLVAPGVGRLTAAATVRKMLARLPVRAVVSTGFAGALDPGLRIGDIFLAENILYRGRRYPARLPQPVPPGVRRGSLLTVNRVVCSAQAKRELALEGAQAVDMESVGVAAVAAEHGLPFFCVRSVSDVAERDLPVDLNRALRSDGTFSVPNMAWQAGLRGSRWLRLLRLWRDGRSASRSLARFLSASNFLA